MRVGLKTDVDITEEEGIRAIRRRPAAHVLAEREVRTLNIAGGRRARAAAQDDRPRDLPDSAAA